MNYQIEAQASRSVKDRLEGKFRRRYRPPQTYRRQELLLWMGVGSSRQNSFPVVSLKQHEDQGSAPDSKPKKKICCACPETKKLRDECIGEHGKPACEKWIEAHRKCLPAEGFNV